MTKDTMDPKKRAALNKTMSEINAKYTASETNFIRNSREAFEKLWLAIDTPARSNDCTITVQRAVPPADLSMEGDL